VARADAFGLLSRKGGCPTVELVRCMQSIQVVSLQHVCRGDVALVHRLLYTIRCLLTAQQTNVALSATLQCNGLL